MKIKLNYIILWIVALAAIACTLLIAESDFLWKVQEMNLFQHTQLFFKQQMVVPGGMLTYLGTYLTQFFYYPWMGVLMLIVGWLIVMWLTKRAFDIPDKWGVLMLIPVALLLVTIVDMGYWVYILKLRGHCFVATLGTAAVAAALWAFRCLPDKYYLRLALIVIIAFVGYPIAGIYGLAATLLMGLFSWRLERKTKAVVYSVVALIATIAVPLLCYRHVYHEINLANIYWAKLPLYFTIEEHHQYYIPYYLLALFYVVLAVTYKTGRKGEVRKRWMWIIAQTAIVAVAVAIAYLGWYKDENYHRELAMQHLVQKMDWEGVVQEAAKQKDEPTRTIVMLKNLALGRLGRQGDEMYKYKNGAKQNNAPFLMRMMQIAGMLVYYEYGMTNYCVRLSTEMGVEYEWRAEYLKYLTQCALLNGEWQVARKYIHQLKYTTFFDDWANHAESLLNKPDLIAKDLELAPIKRMMHYGETLTSDQGFVESFLMKQLSRKQVVDEPVFVEQALYASMWTKKSKDFWYHLEQYVRLNPNKQLPAHVQEAVYLFGQVDNIPNVEKAPISPGVKDLYESFAQQLAKYDGMDVEVGRQFLEPMFGHTFFYDYYLMSNLPEY